jgi:FkbM family methyltransferase
MKVFLDVGAHTGQTLTAAQRWDFDKIVCFEPCATNWPYLQELADKRTVIERFGLWNKTITVPLYDPGSQGGSIWKRPGRSTKSEMCDFVRASDWLRDNVAGCTVWMKVNAEGAEIDILNDLLDSGAFALVDYLEVMWDANKIPAVAGGLSKVQARLKECPVPRVINSKQVPPAKTHVARIDNWLTMTGAAERR